MRSDIDTDSYYDGGREHWRTTEEDELMDEPDSDNCVTCGKLTIRHCPDCTKFCCAGCVTASEATACRVCTVLVLAAENVREQLEAMRRAQQ